MVNKINNNNQEITKEKTNQTNSNQLINSNLNHLFNNSTITTTTTTTTNDQINLNSLNILSELASSVESSNNQTISNQTISDEAFHALLLASLSHQSNNDNINNNNSISIENSIQIQSPKSSSSTKSTTTSTSSSKNNLLNQIQITESNQNYSEFQANQIQLNSLSQISSNKLNLLLPPPPPSSSPSSSSSSSSNQNLNQQINLNNEQQQQHAQDLLSALSVLQSGHCDSLHSSNLIQQTNNIIDTDHFEHQLVHRHISQEELDFEDPNLFSPFEPEHEQINSKNQDTNLLSADIDFLLGTQCFDNINSDPSSPTNHNKIYSNSFSSFHQHHQHEEIQNSNQIESNQLGIYDLENHPDLSFLLGDQQQYQLQEQQIDQNYYPEKVQEHQTQNEDEINQTQELLNRLDYGIKMNQDQIKLQNLNSSIESSLNFNQIYLNLIKKTLDNLNSRQQEANKFLTTSKHCINEIQQQEKQKQRQTQNQNQSNLTIGSTNNKINNIQTTSSSSNNSNNSINNSCINKQNDKDFNLISNQIRSVSLPWFKHKFGVDLPLFEDGKKRDQYNSLLHQQPWQPSERRKLDDEVALQLNLNHQNKNLIDWDTIGRIFPERKPIECKIQWTQKQDPSINKSKWTSIEIDRLFEIVKKFNFQNWDLISNELATGRTPADCVKQFRSVTQEKREWTESDDHLLKEGVSTYGQNWQAVAKHCGRSSNQCINRWSKTLRPDIKKGKWDPIEDEALKNAVAAVGMVWKDVAPRVRGRTDAQCRERWCNILDPRIVVGNWSKEEDDRILRMRDLEGKTWSEISKSFNGRRTDNHCMRRHSELKRAKESKSNRKSMASSTQQAQSSDNKIRLVAKVNKDQTYNNNLTSMSIPRNTLGRVLIPNDNGFSTTRRNNNNNNNTSSSSSFSDSPNLTNILLDHDHLLSDNSSSTPSHLLVPPFVSTSVSNHLSIPDTTITTTPTPSTTATTTTATTHSISDSIISHQVPNSNSNSIVHSIKNSNLNLRNHNSRLRNSNKRIKYSS